MFHIFPIFLQASPCANLTLNDTRVEVSPIRTEHQHNDTVTFSCPNGYDLNGSADALCQFGDWFIDVDPSCEREFPEKKLI